MPTFKKMYKETFDNKRVIRQQVYHSSKELKDTHQQNSAKLNSHARSNIKGTFMQIT